MDRSTLGEGFQSLKRICSPAGSGCSAANWMSLGVSGMSAAGQVAPPPPVPPVPPAAPVPLEVVVSSPPPHAGAARSGISATERRAIERWVMIDLYANSRRGAPLSRRGAVPRLVPSIPEGAQHRQGLVDELLLVA